MQCLFHALVLSQDLHYRRPFLCEKIAARERPAPLEPTIKDIQTSLVRNPPQLSYDTCLKTAFTAGSAGHTFPSTYAGSYVTIRDAVVVATGMNRATATGAHWFAVQMLGGGDKNVGLEVYSPMFAQAVQEGDLLSLTGYVRDIGEEAKVAVPSGEKWFYNPFELVAGEEGAANNIPANYLRAMTHLELCSYEKKGIAAMPAPVVVPAETFGYGCTEAARAYEGMLIKVMHVAVQPCENALTKAKLDPSVDALIRSTGFCTPRHSPAARRRPARGRV